MHCLSKRQGSNIRRNLMMPIMLTVVAAASFALVHCAGATVPDPDSQALRSYRLMIDKVQHYAAASRALKKDTDIKADVAAEIQKMQDEPQHTLADINAMMTHHPKIYSYFEHEGLSVYDTVMLPLALAGAMSAANSPSPAKFSEDVSADQLAFARQHMQELKTLFGSGDAAGR